MTQVEGVSGVKGFRLVVCWIGSGLLIFGGLVAIGNPDSWTNERVAGMLQIAAGVLIMPPILTKLRAKATWLRPIWAPVLLFFLAPPIAVLITLPLAPAGPERARLRAVAITRAKAEIASGHAYQARNRLAKFSSDHDPVVDRLLAGLKVAPSPLQPSGSTPPGTSTPSAVPTFSDPAAEYVDRIKTYWLPEANALPDIPPTDDTAIGELLTKFDGLAINIADGGKFSLTPAQAAVRTRLVEALAGKQRTLLPAMRRKYAEALRAKLFRRDIEVASSSIGNTTMQLTGGIFSLNANIEDLQQANGDVFRRLRFHRIEYRWSRYFHDGYHYDLKVPSDAAVGTWEADEFKVATAGN